MNPKLTNKEKELALIKSAIDDIAEFVTNGKETYRLSNAMFKLSKAEDLIKGLYNNGNINRSTGIGNLLTN